MYRLSHEQHTFRASNHSIVLRWFSTIFKYTYDTIATCFYCSFCLASSLTMNVNKFKDRLNKLTLDVKKL